MSKLASLQNQQIPGATSREEEILAESTRVFARNGFRATDVQVIADSLGIGKGTIYRIFPTKQSLFLACADRAMRRLQGVIHEDSNAVVDPMDRLKAAIKAYFRFFDANPEAIELIIQERAEFKDREKPTYFEHRDRNIAPWVELFEALIADGLVRPMKPEKITNFISHQLYGKLFTHYFTRTKRPLVKDTDEVIEFLCHGFMSVE